jgi:hypothetical protein
MSQERIDEDLTAVEAILRGLDPAASSLDLPQVMYLAGRASARRRGAAGWFWPCTSAALLVLAVTFATAWMSSSQPEVIRQIVYVQRKAPSAVVAEPVEAAPAPDESKRAWEQYREVRRIMLTGGLDALPETDWAPPVEIRSPPWDDPYDATLNRLLGG